MKIGTSVENDVGLGIKEVFLFIKKLNLFQQQKLANKNKMYSFQKNE